MMNKLVGWIARMTCFSFAVALVSVATASIALSIAIFFVYLVMGSTYLEVFKLFVFQAVILVALAGLAHFLLFGMFKKIYIKRLRPLNENIVGYELVENIKPDQLKVVIAELKNFPLLNTLTAIILASLVVVIMMFLAYSKTEDLGILANILLSGGLAVIVYIILTFIVTNAIVDDLRRNAYSELRRLTRQKK
jgi:hypothetical protein